MQNTPFLKAWFCLHKQCWILI